MGHPDVGAQVTADHDVVPCCEGALRPVAANGENRRDWSAHRNQLYRYCRRRPLINPGAGHHAQGPRVDRRHALVAVRAQRLHRMRIAVGLDPVEQIRLGQQGRPIATNSNPSAIARSMVSRLVTPPSRISGRVSSCGTAWRRVVGRRPGRVLAQELVAGHPHAPADRGLLGRGELLERGVPAEQVHRVEQRAARGQLQRVQPAVVLQPLGGLQRLLDGDAAPARRRPCSAWRSPRWGRSEPLHLAAHRQHDAAGHLARFSSDPPNSSVRRLTSGDRNELAR